MPRERQYKNEVSRAREREKRRNSFCPGKSVCGGGMCMRATIYTPHSELINEQISVHKRVSEGGVSGGRTAVFSESRIGNAHQVTRPQGQVE